MEFASHHLNDCSHDRKTVVVAGAGSSIGKVLIPELVTRYDTLVLTENESNYSELVESVFELQKRNKDRNIVTIKVDVLEKEDLQEMECYIEEQGLVVDSFIYLAGINMLVSALEMTEDIWNKMVDINLKGFFFMAQIVARNMVLHQGGSILGIASQHGVVANFNRAAYCASKAGMIHLAKELALEWAKYGIRVNVVSPTMILSEKNKDILEGAHAKKEYLRKIPLKRYALPEDISSAIIFLDSEDASMITGQNLIVDGGWTIS